MKRGGLGLRSLSFHSPAAYIASFLSSGLSPSLGRYLSSSLHLYNSLVDPQDSLTPEAIGDSPLSQKVLSSKIEEQQFNNLFHNASVTDRARLLSISSPHASAWLSVTPSPRLNLHLEPAEFQVALSGGWVFQWSKAKVALTVLPVCWMTLAITPSLANMEGMWFRDTISSGMCFMTSANVLAWVHVWKWVVGRQSRPADVLVPNWDLGKPAAFDLSVTSTLQSSVLLEASVTAGSAALLAENRKQIMN